MSDVSFMTALSAMRGDRSLRFARRGWNGRGMFIYLTEGRPVDVEDWDGFVTDDEMDVGYVDVRSHIDMYTAQGTRVIGWLASQTDMLADDWYEVSGRDFPRGSGVARVEEGEMMLR